MDVPGFNNALKSVTGDGSDAKFQIDLQKQVYSVLLAPDIFSSVRMAVQNLDSSPIKIKLLLERQQPVYQGLQIFQYTIFCLFLILAVFLVAYLFIFIYKWKAMSNNKGLEVSLEEYEICFRSLENATKLEKIKIEGKNCPLCDLEFGDLKKVRKCEQTDVFFHENCGWVWFMDNNVRNKINLPNAFSFVQLPTKTSINKSYLKKERKIKTLLEMKMASWSQKAVPRENRIKKSLQ